MAKVLVTGAAGFIGFHASKTLSAKGHETVGVDSYDEFYDVAIKRRRAEHLRELGVDVRHAGVHEEGLLVSLMESVRPTHVVHLAARPGVRGLDLEPYLQSNLVGFARTIDAARLVGVEHFIYASSSSVYGAGAVPFRIDGASSEPLSIYAATKKSNEALAHAYANLFGLRCTGLRLFTVYGPWGRPDMAVYKFARAIRDGIPIDLFGGGLVRDFTYVDDVIEAIARLLERPPEVHRLLNVGAGNPTSVRTLVEELEHSLGQAAVVRDAPVGPGEALATHADITELIELLSDFSFTPLREGVARFVEWFSSEGVR